MVFPIQVCAVLKFLPSKAIARYRARVLIVWEAIHSKNYKSESKAVEENYSKQGVKYIK